jgi:hypothetical protein
MDIKLNIAILSHLSDLQYDIYENQAYAEVRAKFVRSLLFHNEDTTIRVEKSYLDFMYKQADTRGGQDCSYSEWVVMQECELVK